ncbi:protein of unknown function [Candidatus Methylomirabilis oxygeniifera]|uniref:Uncharacterized protein n=1 Tax=Methylomirabilis oxygeniifera TaxID=671143 RepID=D5MIP4_METO1|nr:protein of unknown function [Candidatus Methylomirabilis oxyfera]
MFRKSTYRLSAFSCQLINYLKIIVSNYRTNPPHLPLPKGGLTPPWKRGARGDFLNRCSFNYETINRMITLNAEN